MVELEKVVLVPAAKGNYGGSRPASQIKFLVYHYTGNDNDTAWGNVSYYARAVVKASAHYFVDDDNIMRSVPDTSVAWAVGGSKWSDCAKTGGGTLYGVATNTNSISIEMCGTGDGLTASEKTLACAAELGRALMAKYNIPIERVIRHFDVTGKHCPAYMMDAKAWAAFKARLAGKAEKEETEVQRYNTMQEISAAAPWATETVQKLIDKGVIRGGGQRDVQGRPADMDLSQDMLRLLVWHDRAGVYG